MSACHGAIVGPHIRAENLATMASFLLLIDCPAQQRAMQDPTLPNPSATQGLLERKIQASTDLHLEYKQVLILHMHDSASIPDTILIQGHWVA